jgi:hypothetical protein
MGLDDAVADSDIIKQIEKSIRYFADYNSEEHELTDKNLDLWEKERCYTGYSIAFHTLYPLYKTTHCDGILPLGPTPDQEKAIKMIVRNKIMDIIKKKNKSEK